MSFVVRHKGTGQYLQGQGAWTPQLDSAMQFNSGRRLLDYLQDRSGVHEKEEGLEIVVLPCAHQSAAPNRVA
jgi:hypothetical protein